MGECEILILTICNLEFQKNGQEKEEHWDPEEGDKRKIGCSFRQMPQLLENANAAALAHAKALEKWQEKFVVLSSDSEK